MIYGAPKKLNDGRYYLKVTNDENSRVMLQLNGTTLVTKFSEGDSVTLSLSAKGQATVDAVNDQNIKEAIEQSAEWFGKTLTEKTLQAAYTSNVKDAIINVNKATVGKSVVTKCFNHEKEPVDLDTLDENTKCDVMVEFAGLWFAKKTFGPIWRLAQVRLKAPPKKLYPDEYLFGDAEEDSGPEEVDEDYI